VEPEVIVETGDRSDSPIESPIDNRGGGSGLRPIARSAIIDQVFPSREGDYGEDEQRWIS
jgi:hypothetical protein